MWVGRGGALGTQCLVWVGRGGTDTHLRTIHDRNDKGEHEKGHSPGDVAVEVQDKDLQLIHLLQHSRGRGGAGSPLWSPNAIAAIEELHDTVAQAACVCACVRVMYEEHIAA